MLQLLFLDDQIITSDPVGEKSSIRTAGLRNSGIRPRVRFWKSPVPVWLTKTSHAPSRSETKAMKRPSGEIVACSSDPMKSVTVVKSAPTSGSCQARCGLAFQSRAALPIADDDEARDERGP